MADREDREKSAQRRLRAQCDPRRLVRLVDQLDAFHSRALLSIVIDAANWSYTGSMARMLRMLILADLARCALVSRVLDHLPIDTAVLGCSDPAEAAAMEQQLGLPMVDDVRAVLAQQRFDGVLMVSTGPWEQAEWQAMAAAGCPVCCTEPIPAPLAGERHVHFVPRYSRSAAIAQAQQTLEEFGETRALTITALTDPAIGSVAARLYDAIELAVALAGPIESVHGRFSTRQHPLPDQPRDIAGQIALALRFDSGAVGSALVGHCASPWLRSCLVTNEAGVLMVDDIACQWHSTQQDSCEINIATTDRATPEMLVADQMMELIDDPPSASPPHRRQVIAAWAAGWLSCRTGQVEYPGQLPIGM